MCGPPTAGKSRTVRAIRREGIHRGPKDEGHKFPKPWRSFEKFVNEVYEGSRHPSLHAKTLRSLGLAWYGDKREKPFVFDELLILCGFSMAIRFKDEYAQRYFEEVPLPAILVNLTAPRDVLMARNEQRKDKSRPEKTDRCIEAHAKFLPILVARGCNILTFDTSMISSSGIAKAIQKTLK